MGMRPTIVEINPFLADLVEAKLYQYSPSDVQRAYVAVCRRAKNAEVDSSNMLADGPSTLARQPGAQQWVFPDSVLVRVLQYRSAIESLEDVALRRLFRVLLGSLLVEVSNVLVNGKGRKYRRNWEENERDARDVDRAFQARCLKAITDIAQYQTRPEPGYEVRRGSFRDHLKGINNQDLAFLSPPYPNSFDYTDIYNLELWVLGYFSSREQESALRHTNIHSHVQVKRDIKPCPLRVETLSRVLRDLDSRRDKLWNAGIPTMVDSYFFDMYELLKMLRKSVIGGGDVFLVVGDSSYSDVVIPVAKVLIEIGEEMGLDIVECRRLRQLRASAQQGGDFVLGEDLLHFRV